MSYEFLLSFSEQEAASFAMPVPKLLSFYNGQGADGGQNLDLKMK